MEAISFGTWRVCGAILSLFTLMLLTEPQMAGNSNGDRLTLVLLQFESCFLVWLSPSSLPTGRVKPI